MKMKYLILILSLLFSTVALQAKTFTYGQVNNMPRSIEKDYYIWRFLSQNTTTVQEATNIIHQASAMNEKLRTAYRTRTGQNAPAIKPYSTGCVSIPAKTWKNRSEANKQFKIWACTHESKTNLIRQHLTSMLRVKTMVNVMMWTSPFFGSI